MIDPIMIEGLIKLLLVFIVISAAVITSIRDLLSIVKAYAVQSALLAALAIVLYAKDGSFVLVYLALLILASKVFIIPAFVRRIQKKMNIKRDAEFKFLSPVSSVLVSIFVILLVYSSFFGLFHAFISEDLFFMGAVIGVSLTMMGMLIIFSRKQAIINIIGYLTMENGVLLFSMFLAELPLIIEALIAIDLIILTLLATILAFGIDSTIEEFHAKLNPFQKGEAKTKSAENEKN